MQPEGDGKAGRKGAASCNVFCQRRDCRQAWNALFDLRNVSHGDRLSSHGKHRATIGKRLEKNDELLLQFE